MTMVSELSTSLTSQSPTTTISSIVRGSSRRNNYGSKPVYSDSIMSSSVRTNAVIVSPAGSVSELVAPTMTISACTEKLSHIATSATPGRTKSRSRRAQVSFAADHIKNKTGACFKRRKIDELQFAASRVKLDLEHGGLPFPALDTSLRHHLDFDMEYNHHSSMAQTTTGTGTGGGIQRLCSKSVSASPFLTANNIIANNNCSSKASMYDLESLFSATFDSYSKSSSSNSICSLASESDSSSSSVMIPPLLEHALNNNKNDVVDKSNASTPESDAVYANPISIREAFENSTKARLVTLSLAPFLVVHVNPAYTRMTGLTPADILGKPFHEVIQDRACKSATAKAHSLASLHEKITCFASNEKTSSGGAAATDTTTATNCRVHVSVVGTETAAAKLDRSLITHFMVSLEEDSGATKETGQEEGTAQTDPSNATGSTTTVTNPAVAVPLPLMESPTAPLMHTMRLHCGVMG